MSIAALNWAFSLEVEGPPKAVLLVLANHANEFSGECWPGLERLSLQSGLAIRTVHKALRILIEVGVLAVVKKPSTFRVLVGAEIVKPAPRADRAPEENRHLVQKKPAPRAQKDAPRAGHIEEPSRTIIEPPVVTKAFSPTATLFGDEPVGKPPALVNGRRVAFEKWWAAYPRKEAKGRAERAYAKALELADSATLLDALNRSWGTKKWIPHPTTWLNDKRWLDEIDRRDPVLAALGIGGDRAAETIEHEDALP